MMRWSRSRSASEARAASSPRRASRSRRAPGPAASATSPNARATSASVSGSPDAPGAGAGRPRTLSTRGSEAGKARPLRYVTARARSSGGSARRYKATRRRFSSRPPLAATRARSSVRSARSAMGPFSPSQDQQEPADQQGRHRHRHPDLAVLEEADLDAGAPRLLDHDEVGDRAQDGEVARQGGGHREQEPRAGGLAEGRD